MMPLCLDGRCGIEAEVLAIPGTDHLYSQRKAVLDADCERSGRQPSVLTAMAIA